MITVDLRGRVEKWKKGPLLPWVGGGGNISDLPLGGCSTLVNVALFLCTLKFTDPFIICYNILDYWIVPFTVIKKGHGILCCSVNML